MSRDPTLTRRHYELIAGIINALDLKVAGSPNAPSTRLVIAHDFSRAFEDTSPGFNREMFINACTVSDRKRLAKAERGRAHREVGMNASLGLSYGRQHVAHRASDPPDEKLTKRHDTSSGLSNACDQDEGA